MKRGITFFVLTLVTFSAFCSAELIAAARPAGAGGVVSLPYSFNDNAGNNWMIYQSGWLQNQGNLPLYSQGAMLMVNGNQIPQRQHQARIDEETGELVIENLTSQQGFQITRRIQFDREQGFVRYLDIFTNPQNQDQELRLQIQSNLNGGVQQSTIVSDPKKKQQNFAWIARTQFGPTVMEMYAGKGSKVAPTIQYTQGNSVVQAQIQLSIPARKQVALVHVHGTAATLDQGVKFVNELKESDLLKDIPRDLRKLIVNFAISQDIAGDIELLRGELFDVVELRTGDQIRGTLKEPAYKVQTFYGTIELLPDRVLGMVNIGQHRPRQLLVTMDGEIFGGRLEKETIDIELTSGQVTQVPLSQISRAGYRKRVGEPEEFTLNQPFVLMQTGDRVTIAPPSEPFEIATRYGMLKLDSSTIAAINFQSPEHGVHEIHLTDGSRFAGLVTGEQFSLVRGLSGPQQTVTFPSSALRRIQLIATTEDQRPDDAPVLALNNDDELVGTLIGELKLDTAFDTLTINAAEVRGLSHPENSPMDVQITLWDETTVSGQLQQPEIRCALTSGVNVSVPISLVREYKNPTPQPSTIVMDRIRAVVNELSAEDWKQRDRAEAQLISMGPSVRGVLKELLASQPPEAQQRIDSILKQLEKQSDQPKSAPKAPAGFRVEH